MLSPRIVIFDLDGTLVEFPKHYLFTELERILPLVQVSVPERHVIEHHFSDFDFFGFAEPDLQQHVTNTFWHHFNWEQFPPSQLFSFTHSILNKLKQNNISSAIATARCCPHQELITDVEKTGILGFFNYIELRKEQTEDWKDKRPQIERILHASSCDPKDAIMVGDIPADIESAKLCGLGGSVAVLSGGIKEEVLKSYQPDFIIPDVSFLEKLIRSL